VSPRARFEQRDLVAELQLAVKMTGASVLAWWLGTLAGEPRPIFAALMPFVAMSGDPFASVSISVERVLGVFVGVALGAALLRLELGLLGTVACAVAAGTLVGLLLRVGATPNVEPAVSALFLIAFGAASTFHAGFARLWETAIGAAIAILIARVAPFAGTRCGARTSRCSRASRTASVLQGGSTATRAPSHVTWSTPTPFAARPVGSGLRL
jgi:uncharacterized membrane protein YccC